MRFLTIVLACVLFVFAGKMQYEDVLAEEAHYCAMVAEGYWPAYDETIDCEGIEK